MRALGIEGGAGTRSGLDLTEIDDVDLAGQVEVIGSLVQRDSAAASAELLRLVDEANRRDLPDVEADAAYLWARAEVNQGHLSEALELIDRAQRLWRRSGDLLQAWRTDLGRMHVLDDLGRHVEAIAVGEALVAALAVADLDQAETEQAAWLRAAALENLGVGHGYLGHHARALEAYAAAEQVYRRLGLEEDVARPLANRGVELIELGSFHSALEALGDAASRFAAHDDDLFVAKCLAYQARAHLLLGDYIGAAGATQRAELHLAELETTTEYARTQLVRAETLASLNLIEEAADLYDDIVSRFTTAELRRDLADATYGRALVQGRRGRTESAIAELRTAAQIYDELGVPAMAAGCWLAESDLVDEVAGAPLVDSAIAVFRKAGRNAELAAALVRKARLVSDARAGRAVLDEATAILDALDIPSVSWRAWHERGRWFLAGGDSDAARSAFIRALNMIDDVRRTVTDERHRLFFMADRNVVLEDLVALDLVTGRAEEAYRITERARARTLVERLSADAHGAEFTVDSDELDLIYDQLLATASPGGMRHVARRLERTLTTKLPRQPVPVPEAVLGGAVPAEVTITYQTIGDEVLAFVHRNDELTVCRRMTTTAVLRDLVAQLDAQWRRFDDPGLATRQQTHLVAVVTDVLQQLHLRLLAPLALPDDTTRFLIVPSAPMGNVPFPALHDGAAHLLERVAVTMAPSSTVAYHAGARRRATFDRRLVIGVADLHAPLVAEEVHEVASLSPHATMFLDGAATVDVLRTEVRRHDVIHIASHGVHRPDNPLFSALRLGDRWLTAAEVAGLPLDGQVVVLSACSSGRQLGVGSGDELIGLPRAFLAAGAAHVVVNLWPVDDGTSRALMTRFHDHLRSSPPAAALRSAQLDLMRHFPHPYYWAPAVVLGAPQPKEPL